MGRIRKLVTKEDLRRLCQEARLVRPVMFQRVHHLRQSGAMQNARLTLSPTSRRVRRGEASGGRLGKSVARCTMTARGAKRKWGDVGEDADLAANGSGILFTTLSEPLRLAPRLNSHPRIAAPRYCFTVIWKRRDQFAQDFVWRILNRAVTAPNKPVPSKTQVEGSGAGLGPLTVNASESTPVN